MTQSTEQFLKELIQHFQCLNNSSISGRTIKGTMRDQETIDKFRVFLDQYEKQYNFDLDFDNSNLSIEFQMPQGKCFESLDKILKNRESRWNMPSDLFCILDRGIVYAKYRQDNDSILKNYESAISLLKLLKEKADHITENADRYELVFLGKNKKLVIADFYSPADLGNLEGFDEFKRQFSLTEDAHKKQRDAVLKNSLIDFFDGSSHVHFSEILKDFTKIKAETQKGLDLYLSEFSYEKIKKEVEKDKFDFTVRMNKVFADIQGQLIGIPIAIIIAGGQMVVKSPQVFEWKNLVILLGYLLFVVFMSLLICNQKNTLDAIKNEYQGHWALIKDKHAKVADRFKPSFDELNKRYEYQVNVMKCVFGLIFISMLGMMALYCKLS